MTEPPPGASPAGVLLVLTDPGDACGAWATVGLGARGLRSVWVTSQDLVQVRHLTHTVDDGGARVRAALEDGFRWSSSTVVGVINRLTHLPQVPGEGDVGYAQQEMNAVAVSWLHALSRSVPFLGRPGAAGLCGPWRSPGEWMLQAGACGLRTVPVRLGRVTPLPFEAGEERVVVLLDTVHCCRANASPPDDVREALVRLAASTGSDVLEVRCRPRDGWRVLGVTHLADLTLTGTRGLERLVRHFTAAGAAAPVPAPAAVADGPWAEVAS